MEDVDGIHWDITGRNEVRRTCETHTVPTNGHGLGHKGLPERAPLKLNGRYMLIRIQGYAPTPSHGDEKVEQQGYEDVELATKKAQTQYTVVTNDFNAKAGRKQKGEEAIGD